MDWPGLLKATAAGQLKVEPLPGEPSDAELPPTVHELQEAADKMIGLIAYPERMLMSPLAYLAYDAMCRAGVLSVVDLRATWRLSQAEAEAVIQELGGIYLWTYDQGQLKPFPAEHMTDLFHGTGVMRATYKESIKF
jgi:hypothetical protein